MKILSFILLFILLSSLLVGCSNNEVTTDGGSSAQKLSTNISVSNTEASKNTLSNEIRIGAYEPTQTPEEELATFSTKLGGKNTPRSRNIGITSSFLNETIVKNGETFSFCNTIGKPTPDRGYEEADSFDTDGKTIKTFGRSEIAKLVVLFTMSFYKFPI